MFSYAIHKPTFEKYTFKNMHALLPQRLQAYKMQGLDCQLPKTCGWQHGELTTENLAMAPKIYGIS